MRLFAEATVRLPSRKCAGRGGTLKVRPDEGLSVVLAFQEDHHATIEERTLMSMRHLQP